MDPVHSSFKIIRNHRGFDQFNSKLIRRMKVCKKALRFYIYFYTILYVLGVKMFHVTSSKVRATQQANVRSDLG